MSYDYGQPRSNLATERTRNENGNVKTSLNMIKKKKIRHARNSSRYETGSSVIPTQRFETGSTV